MNTYKHLCPHCMTTLSVEHIDELTMLVQCPICQKQLLLSDHGRSLREAPTIACIKCQHEMVYDGKAEEIVCDKCGEKFKVAKGGACIIETELYEKGQKGELPFTKFPDKVIARKNKARSIVSKCFGYGLWLAILAGIGWIVYKEATRPIPIENTLAFQDRDSLWCEFREKNPYNIQMEGIRKYPDGSYNLVISEPSPAISIDRLSEVFEPYNASITTKKHPLGYDGWLKDAIICFNNIKEKDLPTLEIKVTKTLYGTDYKAHFADFSNIPQLVAFANEDLNYQVTEEELRQWFIYDEEPLQFIDDSSKVTTLSAVLSSPNNGANGRMLLLQTKEPGFVIWVLNRSKCYASLLRVAARKFALDSDLILGAIASKEKVAIIGRERSASYMCMPPLRSETIDILARTDKQELGQSFEWLSLFSGKLPGGKDFCPVYLSDELWHTEFGSILIITDQMIKSWSENGLNDYVRFDYPKPVDWAFASGAHKELKANELTYNWNTSGLGYIVEDEGYSVFALNRTGSLPVSYIPGEAHKTSKDSPVYRAEETAFDFFSFLSNPLLIREVQYTALYQIFHSFGIGVNSDETANTDILPMPSLKLLEYGKSIVEEIRDFEDVGLEKIVSHNHIDVVEKDPFHRVFLDVFYPYYTLSDGSKVYKAHDNEYLYELYGNLSQSKWLQKKCYSKKQVNEFASICSLVNTLSVLSQELLSRGWYYGLSNCGDYLKLYLTYTGRSLDMQGIRNGLVEENKSKYREWIKCPTIVESWLLRDSTTAIGGHNLDSKVTFFKVGSENQGKVNKVDENDALEISRQDRQNRVVDQAFLRRVARLGDSDIRGVSIPTRTRASVIPSAPRKTRGFSVEEHLKIKVTESGHEINGKLYTDLTELLSDVGKFVADGESDVKKIEIQGLKTAGVDVDVYVDGVFGQLRKGSCASIPIDKYDVAHYTVETDGDVATVTIPIKPGTIKFGSTSNVRADGLGGLTTATPSVKIKSGEVRFRLPKAHLEAFIQMIKDFISKQKGYWNEFKLKREMKQRGINPADCEEFLQLQVAKNNCIILIKGYKDVWVYSQQAIA